MSSSNSSANNVECFLTHIFDDHEGVFRLYKDVSGKFSFIFVEDLLDRYLRSKHCDRLELRSTFQMHVSTFLSGRSDCVVGWTVSGSRKEQFPIVLLSSDASKSCIKPWKDRKSFRRCDCQSEIILSVRTGNFVASNVLWPVWPNNPLPGLNLEHPVQNPQDMMRQSLQLLNALELQKHLSDLERRKAELESWARSLEVREAALLKNEQNTDHVDKDLIAHLEALFGRHQNTMTLF